MKWIGPKNTFIKNYLKLVWPYDLTLLKTLGVALIIVFTILAFKFPYKNQNLLKNKNYSTLYLNLFSAPNAFIEFDRELGDYYAFPKVSKTFGDAKVHEIEHFSKTEFEALVLATLPLELRPKLLNYLPFVLATAQKYQVDPFWLLSIMWTESHFNHLSKSSQMAMGLMQIVPETGYFITQKFLKRGVTFKDVQAYISEPFINIELGTIYLKTLLDRFKNNYRLATAAYNLGPNRVMEMLSVGLKVGSRNDYVDKVHRSYARLTKYYLLALKEESSKKVYVYAERPLPHEQFVTSVPLNLQKAFNLAKNKDSLAQASN